MKYTMKFTLITILFVAMFTTARAQTGKTTGNDITKIGNITIFEKPVSVDTISVPVLCERALMCEGIFVRDGAPYTQDVDFLGVEIVAKRQEITVKRVLQPTNIWEINKGHYEELRESFVEIKHWIDPVKGCYQLVSLKY